MKLFLLLLKVSIGLKGIAAILDDLELRVLTEVSTGSKDIAATPTFGYLASSTD